MSRYDWLLFLHVLAAFAIVGSVVVFTVVMAATRGGAEATPVLRLTPVARRLWDVGGAGTLIFGVWLAIDLDQYGLFDGWVLAALALWAIAAAGGIRLGQALQDERRRGTSLPYAVMTVAVAALLVVMIYKPGA